MKRTISSKVQTEKTRQVHIREQEIYKDCEKSKSRINPIFTRPPYSACDEEVISLAPKCAP